MGPYGNDHFIITVDGVEAVRVVPMPATPRTLSSSEVATFRVLMAGVERIDRSDTSFDAVTLVGKGRAP